MSLLFSFTIFRIILYTHLQDASAFITITASSCMSADHGAFSMLEGINQCTVGSMIIVNAYLYVKENYIE